jgi:catechol 2,3-dioxygenase-like lactoylglutathione lyase family enzyme
LIDHLGLGVTRLSKSRAFYEAALAPLGYAVLMELTAEQTGRYAGIGMGVAPKPDFWLSEIAIEPVPLHIAFAAANRAQVDNFYAAAIAAGGKDNGAPGLRPHYHPNYYGAFVIDCDGHNIEAVCHQPE